MEIDKDGNKIWRRNGKKHRDDGPAVEYADGDKLWFQNGKIHRDDGPAAEYASGHKTWNQNGKLHRSKDMPAVEWSSGRSEWYKNGVHYSPNWKDIHVCRAIVIASCLSSYHVPVLILVEIISKTLYREGLTMYQVWEVCKLIRSFF